MDDPMDTFQEMIARGVPWPLAREALATTRMSKDDIGTHSLEESDDGVHSAEGS